MGLTGPPMLSLRCPHGRAWGLGAVGGQEVIRVVGRRQGRKGPVLQVLSGPPSGLRAGHWGCPPPGGSDRVLVPAERNTGA